MIANDSTQIGHGDILNRLHDHPTRVLKKRALVHLVSVHHFVLNKPTVRISTTLHLYVLARVHSSGSCQKLSGRNAFNLSLHLRLLNTLRLLSIPVSAEERELPHEVKEI